MLLILPTALSLEAPKHLHHRYYRKLVMGNTMNPVLAYTYVLYLPRAKFIVILTTFNNINESNFIFEK